MTVPNALKLPPIFWLMLIAALLLVTYAIFREEVDQKARELLADKTIDSDDPDPSSIQANLEEVQLTPAPPAQNAAASNPREFLLSARYVDEQDSPLVGSPPMEWIFDPLAEGAASPAGKITVSTFPATGSAPAEAKVSAGEMFDKVVVTRWADPGAAASAGDVVEAKETLRNAAGPPSVVLVEEASEWKCRWGRARAFVGAAAVGEQTINPCSLSLLSPDHALVFQDNADGGFWPPDKWAGTGTSVSLNPAAPLNLDVTVFLAVPPVSAAPTNTAQATGPASNLLANPTEQAKNDVALANMLYEANRVGIRINVKGYVPLAYTPDWQALVGADPYDCVRPVKLPGNPNQSDFAYDSAAVSVYYVDRINFPLDPAYPRVRGMQCHYWYSGNPAVGNVAAIANPALGNPPGNGPVVYISYSHHSPVTLAHELGHALGLNDEEGRLGHTDIMHNLLPDGDLGANARSHLRVGQVLRMNVWNDSWINTRVPQPPRRACDDLHPCPPVDLDAR